MLEVAIKWDYISFNPNTRIEKPKSLVLIELFIQKKKKLNCFVAL